MTGPTPKEAPWVSWRGRWELPVVMLLAVAARLPWLGILPGPSGDEGVWVAHARSLIDGVAWQEPSGAGYASSLHAHLLAVSMRLFGDTFAGERVVVALAGPVGVAVVWAWARREIGPRAGLGAALVMALHPLAVLWSRTGSVPYAWQATVGVAGAALLLGSGDHEPRRHAVGVLLLALGLHFGPIHAATGLAVAIELVRTGRWRRLAHPLVAAAIVLAIGVALPLLWADAGLGDSSREPTLVSAPVAMGRWLRNVAFGLGGGWTVAHFGAWRVAGLAPLAIVAAIVVLGAALGQKGARRGVTALAWVQLVCLVVVVPALLRFKGLAWSSSKIDRDRYLVTAVPYLALVVGGMFEAQARWRRRLAASFVVAIAAGTALVFATNLLSGGPDRGLGAMGGGAYRGWRVVQGERPLMNVLADAIAARADAGRITTVIGDHAFDGPLRLLLAPRGIAVQTAQGGVIAPGSGALCAVVYTGAAFASPDLPGAHDNETLRAAALARPHARVLTTVRDRRGQPWAEIVCDEVTPREAGAP